MAFIDLNTQPSREIAPGFHGKFIHTDNISIAHWDIRKGASIPLHDHVHEMVVNVVAGELELTVGGEVKVLKPGMCATIPGHVPHKATAITDCQVIDVFYPVREDYKSL
ncbi:MAG: cupin domain-containing protein [Bacteroidia bacterium]|nr:cupin domain-containing protein [Bacteroidia bacterium]